MNKKAKELCLINNRLDKQISSENKEAFTDMICYLRGANISEYHQELVRQDLTEMVLSAQQRGENIQAVIGGDYRAFCDEVIASLPLMTRKQMGVQFVDIVCWCLSILGLINIIFADETIALILGLFRQEPLNFYISVSIGSMVSVGFIIVAAFFIVEFVMKRAFQIGKGQKGDSLKAFIFSGGLTAICILIRWWGRTTLFSVHIFFACSVVLMLYIAHKLLTKI